MPAYEHDLYQVDYFDDEPDGDRGWFVLYVARLEDDGEIADGPFATEQEALRVAEQMERRLRRDVAMHAR